MIIEPGILDLAHKQGVKFLDDVNHDGKIDAKDLALAKAKAGVVTSVKASASPKAI